VRRFCIIIGRGVSGVWRCCFILRQRRQWRAAFAAEAEVACSGFVFGRGVGAMMLLCAAEAEVACSILSCAAEAEVACGVDDIGRGIGSVP
jgi:hypothetical protein